MALPKLNVPQYKVNLPSTGEQLNMRPYLVKEEKILLMALESKDPVQISTAIRNIITNCYNLNDPDVLTSFDLEFLFLQLRAKSVGEKMAIQYKCQAEECDNVTEAEINIDDLKVTGLNNEDNTFVLDEDLGVGITMRYPTLSSLSNLETISLETAEGLLDLVKICIDTIFDKDNVYKAEEQTDEELQDFIGSFTSEQFKHIQEFFAKTPAVVYNDSYVCTKCNKENEIELKGLNSFFT